MMYEKFCVPQEPDVLMEGGSGIWEWLDGGGEVTEVEDETTIEEIE